MVSLGTRRRSQIRACSKLLLVWFYHHGGSWRSKRLTIVMQFDGERLDKRSDGGCAVLAVRCIANHRPAVVWLDGARTCIGKQVVDLNALALIGNGATIVSGSTDVGLWITKGLAPLGKIVWLGRVRGLDAVESGPDRLSLGAAVTHAMAFPVLGLTLLVVLAFDLIVLGAVPPLRRALS